MTIEWRGDFIEVRREGRWEYAARTRGIGAAVILAVTNAREIVLVEQYRVPLGKRCLELPAGLIGDMDDGASAHETAERELAEETGFTATHFEDLGEFATSPGMTSETFHLFRATGLNRTGAGGGVGGEAIDVHVVALAALAAFIDDKRRAGVAIDCRLVVALPLL